MRKVWGITGLAAVALAVTACGSSGGTAATGGSPPAAAASSQDPSSPAASSPAASSAAGTVLSTKTIHGKAVLTNSAGLTLYWFAPDSSTASKCSGQCASYWPPVKGPATAGSGVTGKLGTITRSDGSMQVTYDGHPLYTYIADTAPGQAKGNAVNASGGLWYEMTVSGIVVSGAVVNHAPPATQAPAPAASQAPATPAPATSSGGGGGYGY